MLLKEVMQKSGLTRKQIEILQQKGLIHPAREENGYRNYTEQDLKTLKQVNFLKKFEFTLDECHALLIEGDTAVLDQKREQLYDQISAGQRGQKIIQMENEIVKAQVSFNSLIEYTIGIGFSMTAIISQQNLRLIILIVTMLLVQGMKSSTRFRWLILRMGQFLRVI